MDEFILIFIFFSSSLFYLTKKCAILKKKPHIFHGCLELKQATHLKIFQNFCGFPGLLNIFDMVICVHTLRDFNGKFSSLVCRFAIAYCTRDSFSLKYAVVQSVRRIFNLILHFYAVHLSSLLLLLLISFCVCVCALSLLVTSATH